MFETREKIVGPKWNTLQKHGGMRKAKKDMLARKIKKGQFFAAYNCRHLLNKRWYAAKQVQKLVTVLLQEVKRERARKKLHMATILHLLQQGRYMLEYEAIKPLLQFLETLKLA